MQTLQSRITDTVNGADRVQIALAAMTLQKWCHGLAFEAGWWTDLKSGETLVSGPGETPKVNVPEKLMLIVSEAGEAMEGHRKGLMDDHLEDVPMFVAELADVVIRAFDTAGGLGHELGTVIARKLQYNATRADHKIDNRKQEGGKAY